MIATCGFPRVGDKEELALRLIGGVPTTGNELVEKSDGRIGAGAVYALLGKLDSEGWLKREGRWYSLTRRGWRLLHALDVAAKAFSDGSLED